VTNGEFPRPPGDSTSWICLLGPACQHHMQTSAQQASLPAFRERGHRWRKPAWRGVLRIRPVNGSISSSGNRVFAHQHAAVRSIAAANSSIAAENSPRSERSAHARRCRWRPRSGRLRSRLGPGRACRLRTRAGEFAARPGARQLEAALEQHLITTGPPWPCNSSTSSPVYGMRRQEIKHDAFVDGRRRARRGRPP